MASGRVLLASLLLLAGAQMLAFGQKNNFSAEKVGWIRFLVTVNDTWNPDGCIATVATDQLLPNKKYNQSEKIMVGSCDQGPLVYTVSNAVGSARESAKMYVDLTFYSSVIEDASPPTCHIPWNGTYVSPRPNTDPRDDSPLPGCFTMESREGYHMTAYWFYLLDWSVDLTFYSSVIEDAEPPTCHIPWNGTYVSPRPGKDARDDSPLPGCVTSDSREGWYLTYYWFYLLDWGWAP